MKAAPWESGFVRGPGKKKPDGSFGPGAVLANVANALLIFSNHRSWAGLFAYDEFVGDIVATRPPPWKGTLSTATKRLDWTDTDMARAKVWLEQSSWHLSLPTNQVVEAVRICAEQRVVHPVRDWLNSLTWDKKPRIDDVFIRLAGAPDDKLTRAVSSKFFIGAVARAMNPGSKVDSMPIFEGPQGAGKSTLLRVLAGEDWFLETNIEVGTKDSYQTLRKKWIIELGELDSLNRSEVSKVKQFLTQRVDSYRPSYGRATMDFRRQCVFAGTVNPDGGGYLKDNTGARRFWPISVGKVDTKALGRERRQLWAEAAARYKAKEQWYLDDPKLIAQAAEVTEDRRQVHPWETPIWKWLLRLGDGRIDEGVSTHDVLVGALDIPVSQHHVGTSMQAAAALRVCGWIPLPRRRIAGVPMRLFGPADRAVFLQARDALKADRQAQQEERARLRKEEEKKKAEEGKIALNRNLARLVDQAGSGGTAKAVKKPVLEVIHLDPPDPSIYKS